MKVIFLFLFLMSHLFSNLFHDKEGHKKVQKYYQDDDDSWDSSTLLGSSVTKKRLAQSGITSISSFTTDIVGNPIGGNARGFAYAGTYGLSVNIDLTKAGLSGFELYSSAAWRTGTSLSSKIGNEFPVQQVFGSQTVKLNELYFIQTLLNGNVSFKAGRLNAGNDFLASPLYENFVNHGFNGNPISPFINVPITSYPNATWGARLFLKPHKRLSMQFAAYNANTEIEKNKYHGVNFTFKSTNGVIWITEWCLLINQEREDLGMPGNYKVGYFYLTGDEPKFGGGKGNGNNCYYFLFDQMIYRFDDSKRGITPFISFLFAPKNRNLFPFFFDCGVVITGPFSQRPNDLLNIGYAYGKYSQDLASNERRTGEEPQNFESVLELNYWIQINKWFYIAPDLQYIIHPKGKNIPNAYVIGAQIGINIW